MSTIAPNGQVRLLADVPIDDTYENSLYFANELAQRTYFLGLTSVHTMSNATRVRDGVIAVDELADNLLTCNYLMFQNQAFSTKWFYAFITDIVYVNNNMTHIYYEIDEIQTWLFATNGVTLQQCFVEREHVRNDSLFHNLIPEDFTVSEYVNSDLATQEKDLSVMSAIVFTNADVGTTYDDDPIVPDINAYNGMLNGSEAKIYFVQDNDGNWYPLKDEHGQYLENDMVQINKFIRYLINKNRSESIIAIIMYPKELINYAQDDRYPVDSYMRFNNYNTNSEIDGYTPRNNKLYNSPYCYIEFGTTDGQKDMLRPEYLPTTQCELEILSNVSPDPSFLVVPKQYCGDNYSWDMAISYNALPQVSCAIDGYKAWVASGGKSTMMLNFGESLVNDIINVGEGVSDIAQAQNMYSAQSQFGTTSGRANAVEKGTEGVFKTLRGATDLGFDIAKTVNASAIAKRLPPKQKGYVNSTPLTANKKIGVYVRWKTVNSDVAKSVDDFFTMFGYKVNTVKVPSLNNRQNYTFVKTKGCKCNGGAPSTSINTIQKIFNKGIRFWSNPANVGDYSVTNNPI